MWEVCARIPWEDGAKRRSAVSVATAARPEVRVSEVKLTSVSPREGNAWDQIKARLAQRIAPQEYQNWVMRTVLDRIEDRSLRIAVPDQVTKDFIEQEYSEQIRTAILDLGLPVETVVYLPYVGKDLGPVDTNASEPVFTPVSGQLNTKFRFENFVVGSCNQFAHAAALAVSTNPS